MRLLQNADLRNKTVFLRVDYNVPIIDGKISDSFRIKATLPTIKFLLECGAKIVIGTHLGQPKGKRTLETSVVPVARELQRLLGSRVQMAPDIVSEEIVYHVRNEMKPGQILVIENLRWDPREEVNDSGFAKELASLADVYINDAFAVSHRANASISAITQFLPSYPGMLLQSEITKLGLFLDSPIQPFLLIVGGIKIKDKASMIARLGEKADRILVGGGVANTFLKALGENIGSSIYDAEMVSTCNEMLKKYGNKLIVPVDGTIEKRSNNFQIMDIGEETRKIYASEIARAKTVFWNGSLGKSESSEYAKGMLGVAQALQKLEGTTVVAGGDTVGFLSEHNLVEGVSFASTGGGAALEYLAGEKLPGLVALK